MPKYIKCPRCELNYIDADAQDYCDVCIKEMKGLRTEADEIEEEEEEYSTDLCPVCGENMMRSGEKMCEECRRKAELETEEPSEDDDDEWRNYLDDDADADLDPEIGKLDESLGSEFADEIEEEEEEEEEEYIDEEEDMEYVTGDEIYTLAGDDDDDDDDKPDDDDF